MSSAAIRKLQHELGIPTDTFSVDDFTNVIIPESFYM